MGERVQPRECMVESCSYYLYFAQNQNELPRQLILRQALSRVGYNTDLNIYFMVAYVIPIAVASILIKYGFILLKIFQSFSTAVS